MSYAPTRPNGQNRAQAQAADSLSPAERHIMEMAKREHRETTAAAQRAARASGGGGVPTSRCWQQEGANALGQQEDLLSKCTFPPLYLTVYRPCVVLTPHSLADS